MSLESQMEREEESLADALEDGRITQADYNEAIRDLQREYRDAAHEAAQSAYDRELENW